ncbi:sulfurtransferase TusE [Arenicella chitinivorans]|uniref:Sulfurtransferase n=1 Tax=Arenicella chitinivorans TaxID=1329800 RepID=A0A918VM76_9GAMM|nr:TusE/DsrC/DsvC family sulfur relay protein [Arenicella chitinivorans]GHA07182.1 sulfurtransferase TusE [Arenicella chitinivorans]
MTHSIEFNGHYFDTDVQGFLKDRLLWSEELGRELARRDGVELTDEHWEVIHYFREYYDDYNIPPPIRMVIRVFKKAFGEEKANSRYLLSLFPEGATKSASKYAGLPKPKNCK